MTEDVAWPLTTFERLLVAYHEASFRRGAEIERDRSAAAQDTDAATAVAEAGRALRRHVQASAVGHPGDAGGGGEEQAKWERERGHSRQRLCPGIERHPDILGGEPVIVGTRLPALNIFRQYEHRLRTVQSFETVLAQLAEEWHVHDVGHVREAVAFEAGRRWGEQHDRAERKRSQQHSGEALERIEAALDRILSTRDAIDWYREGRRDERGQVIADVLAALRRRGQEELAKDIAGSLEGKED